MPLPSPPGAPTLPVTSLYINTHVLCVCPLLKGKFHESGNQAFLLIYISRGLAQELVCPLHWRNISWTSWLNHSNHLFQMRDETQTEFLLLSTFNWCQGWWWLIRRKMGTWETGLIPRRMRNGKWEAPDQSSGDANCQSSKQSGRHWKEPEDVMQYGWLEETEQSVGASWEPLSRLLLSTPISC